MTEAKAAQKLEKLVRRLAPRSRLLRTWNLKGGISSQAIALEIEQPDGQAMKMVVRHPHAAADEFRLLQITQAAGLATQRPYHLDESGEIYSTPFLVIEYIEGELEFAPSNLSDYLLQLATNLTRIHNVDSSNQDLSFLPGQSEILASMLGERPPVLDGSLDEGHIRAALESVWPLPQRNNTVLLHGDYWPGNILWKDSQLVAVLDWEDAQLGDPLADLATSRLEVLWAFGIDAMNDFTHHYQSITRSDLTDLPCWDLFAALRPASKIAEWAADWGDPPIERNDVTERTMREGHRLFVTQAFDRLSFR